MAAAERHRVASAPRLRGPGTRAFQRPAGAFLAGVRGGEYSGLQRYHFRAVFSCLATADEARFRETAHHHDPEEPAPLRTGVITDRRFHERRFLRNSRIPRSGTSRKD